MKPTRKFAVLKEIERIGSREHILEIFTKGGEVITGILLEKKAYPEQPDDNESENFPTRIKIRCLHGNRPEYADKDITININQIDRLDVRFL